MQMTQKATVTVTTVDLAVLAVVLLVPVHGLASLFCPLEKLRNNFQCRSRR